MRSVQVLLATYNGERFLQEQLDSLFAQTRQDFEILAADDGSDDGTLGLLETSAASHPGRVRILYRDRVGGPARNFMRLIDAADADYVLCCDQDDLWMPDKVERMVNRCIATESTAPGLPVLVHSDLVVVDECLRPIARSMFQYQKMRPSHATFRLLLLQSNVTGCAMLMNRSLIRIVQGSGNDAMLMHDWWISIAAAAFGRIEFLSAPTLHYRQHPRNTQGVGGWGWHRAARRTGQILQGATRDGRVSPCASQARAFLSRFGPKLSAPQLTCVTAASRLDRQSRSCRAYSMVRHRLLCGGFTRSIARLLLA